MATIAELENRINQLELTVKKYSGGYRQLEAKLDALQDWTTSEVANLRTRLKTSDDTIKTLEAKNLQLEIRTKSGRIFSQSDLIQHEQIKNNVSPKNIELGEENIWTIKEFSRTSQKEVITSPPFYSHGYKLRCIVRFNSTNVNGFASVYYQILKGENDASLKWPFSRRVVITLVDQNPNDGNAKNKTHVIETSDVKGSFDQPLEEDNTPWGNDQFISYSELRSKYFVRNDQMQLIIAVE